MLYPFAWVNRPARPIAAAAGGCMLARREALLAAGGIESIRGELIDDCALARRLKARGPIRLTLTERVRSLRPYAGIGEIRRMVARSAYAQLRFAFAAHRHGAGHGRHISRAAARILRQRLAAGAGGLGRHGGRWPFQPVLRFYRLSPLWGLALPAIAAPTSSPLDSAWQLFGAAAAVWRASAQAPGALGTALALLTRGRKPDPAKRSFAGGIA
jgi:hypothetical protein